MITLPPLVDTSYGDTKLMSTTTDLQLQPHKMIAGFRASALIEIALFFIIALVIDYAFMQGNHFAHVTPHPFWIIVLLMATQYGTNEALLGAILSSIVLLIGDFPAQAEGQDWYTYVYDISLTPILWIVFAVIIGEIRQRHRNERERLRKELNASLEREEKIAESYETVSKRKENLETQIAGQLNSAVAAYRAAKAVETLNPGAVMKGIEELVSAVIGAKSFSLYLFNNNKLSATLLHGWEQDAPFARELDEHSPLYRAILGEKAYLCVANQDHESTLDKQGVLAGPVISPDSGQVVGMLKVEALDFTSLGLQTIETFRALCEWTGNALVNARNFQTVKKESVIDPQKNLMTASFFERQSAYVASLAKRVGFDLGVLIIKQVENETLDDDDRLAVARGLSNAVQKVLRSVDLAFDYQTDGGEYSILLPATNTPGANIVRDKIAKELEKQLRNFKKDVQFSYIVQPLHEAS